MIGYEQFLEEEQPRLRAEGKHVGIGIVTYVEGTGIGPYEGAKVTVEASGTRQRRHRHRHAGAGPFHLLRPDRGRPARRAVRATSAW